MQTILKPFCLSLGGIPFEFHARIEASFEYAFVDTFCV